MSDDSKIWSFSHGSVISAPLREQPVVVIFYAEFKHGPLEEPATPYMSQNLNLTLDAAKSLVANMTKAIEHAETMNAPPEPQPMECIGKECASPEVCANPNVRCALV